MATVEDVLRIAQENLGYAEQAVNRTKFGQWYGLNGSPWCAMFVSYCFYLAGMPLTITTGKGFSYCPDGMQWFKKRNRWFTDSPLKGDVAFFCWSGDGVAEHVGLVESVNADGSVVCIEGNTSPSDNSNGGQVMRRHYRQRNQFLGFGRPPYSSTPAPQVPAWPGRYITLTTPYTRGNDVLVWQRQMIALGYHLGSGGSTGKGDDGVFGQNSYAALRQLQADHGLKADGVLGPLSWNRSWSQQGQRPIKTLLKIGTVSICQIEGQSAFFYKAGMSIDADGAANAYHPEDKGIDFLDNAGYPGNWWGIVTDQNGNPVIQGSSDPYPGYYVSTTALAATEFNQRDPRRYVDATKIPYIVLPGNGDLRRATGIKPGDVAVVYNAANEKVAFAIYADIGPKDKIGEGSIALAQALGHDPFINGKVRRGIAKGITYLVFPNSGNGKPKTVAEIAAAVKPLFEQWGGVERIGNL